MSLGTVYYRCTCKKCSKGFRSPDIDAEYCYQCGNVQQTSVISRSDVDRDIARLKSLIESGYGFSGKPIPPKRMAKLKETLAQLEAHLNGL